MAEPLSTWQLLESFNVQFKTLESLLKNLEMDGAVERVGSRWQRTLTDWSFDHRRVEEVTALRRAEQAQMLDYIRTGGCRMQLLASYLDDSIAEPCEICDNCSGESLAARFDPATVQPAVEHIRRAGRDIEPRKQLPDRQRIPEDQRLEPGRALSVWADSGWGRLVRDGKQTQGQFNDQLVRAAADLIRNRWRPEPAPTWITFVPSRRNPGLVADFTGKLTAALDLPCESVVVKVRDTEPQKTMQNSFGQYRNVQNAFEVRGAVLSGPVLLVDDIVDSRWTLTAIGGMLLAAGSGPVFPFALADAAGRSAT